jgi:tetratricopeptide (TPR) repeat protein
MSTIKRSAAFLSLLLTSVGVLLTGCGRERVDYSSSVSAPDPCAIALATHRGTDPPDPIDQEISRLQTQARNATQQSRAVERLGWTFVEKARLRNDPGYYKLAEACAQCLDSAQPRSPESLLLRGHVMHNLHRFKEAEVLAQELVQSRGYPFDYGLLGDALMEQGRLGEAIDAYQKMMDMKPGPQAYSRAAHVRWLKGDLRGAIEMMGMAAQASGPSDRESAAWAYTRLSNYELQAGEFKNSLRASDAALSFRPGYAAALLARGRVLLATGKTADAVEPLRQAADSNPLPEYQWTLAEALRASGQNEQANRVEDQLVRAGAASDPRTFALFLATRRQMIEQAVGLCRQELEVRADVFTLDALAWALAAGGRNAEASSLINRALSEKTSDARLFFHAGVIAAMDGRRGEARGWLTKASAIKQMLLPSERDQLAKEVAAL